jgi:hypothetical protein
VRHLAQSYVGKCPISKKDRASNTEVWGAGTLRPIWLRPSEGRATRLIAASVPVRRSGRMRGDGSAYPEIARRLFSGCIAKRSGRPGKKERTACPASPGGRRRREAVRNGSYSTPRQGGARQGCLVHNWIQPSGCPIKQRYICTKLKFGGIAWVVTSAVAPGADRRQSNCRTCPKCSSLAGHRTPCDDRAPAHILRKSAHVSLAGRAS